MTAPLGQAARPAPELADVALRMRRNGREVRARFLTRFGTDPAESRRDALARLARWAGGAEVAVVVLDMDAGGLLADFRALGFDDAGPLPRYFAPARPGPLRRVLTAAALPEPRIPEGVVAASATLSGEQEHGLRARLASAFGAAVERPPEPAPPAGAHVLRGGRPIASCRFAPVVGAEVEVRWWIAPPGEPDSAALLALEALRAAAAAGAVGISFETSHAVLGKGLLLARFLPRRSRARILVRRGGERGGPTPRTGDWHLTAPSQVRAW